MAPEALKSGAFTLKTDIWSYGILLYEVYSGGSIPFPHVQPYEQLAALERGERPERPDPCPEDM
ncbi:TK/KIN6 protein kinase [Aphelenchoides avenae]|nr:TK/KIN6 protein kinase [Aphelenchus avenae]